MTFDERLQQAAHGVADRVEAPYVDVAAVRAGARDRARRTQTAVVAVVVVIVALAGLAIQLNRNAKSLEPVTPPPGNVPVWYDAAGLHHGDVVEQTPVEVWDGEGGDLALVRTGALYRDQANNDVWFHPWGGEPRIVGRDSREGPGGDPNGDLAAWFEGQEMVVYDTAKDLEVSRTIFVPRAVVAGTGWRPRHWGQPLQAGVGPAGGVGLRNGAVYRFDVATGEVSELWNDRATGFRRELQDVHDDIVALVPAAEGGWRSPAPEAPTSGRRGSSRSPR